jgi:hypothetical protein
MSYKDYIYSSWHVTGNNPIGCISYLDRDSNQSPIRQFVLVSDYRKIQPAEQGIALVKVDLYQTLNIKLLT